MASIRRIYVRAGVRGVWAISSDTKGLLLALRLEITPGGAQRIIWGAGDRS